MAQYFEAALGAGPLRERLRDIFSHRQPPTPLHQFLASMPAPLLVVTTNYDDLLERAFQAAGKPYDVRPPDGSGEGAVVGAWGADPQRS